MTRLLIACTTALCFTMLNASVVGAQESPKGSETENDQARALYLEGDAHYQKGDFARAEVAFRAAWGIKKHWQIAYNLGDCELRNNKPRDAAEHLAFALHTADESKRAEIEDLLGKATDSLHALNLEVSQPGADISVDGVVVGSTPLADPIYLLPGEHRIEAKKVGFRPVSKTIAATKSTVSLETIELEPVEQKPVWPAGLLGAVSALGVGIGIGLSVVAVNKYGDAETQASTCDSEACLQNVANMLDDYNSFLGAGIGMSALGGAALVGMIVYLALPGPDPNAGQTSVTWSIVPILGPTAAGGLATFTF